MDVVKLLPEYLDIGVDEEEMRQISLAAVAQRIRELKLAVAQSVVQARASTLMDNLEGANSSLQQARRLQQEYHHFYAQWRRLGGLAPAGEEEKPQRLGPGPAKDDGSSGGTAEEAGP